MKSKKPSFSFVGPKFSLEVSPLKHQLDVDVGTDVESLDSILSVGREAKDPKVQIGDKP